MLKVHIKTQELFDEANNEFVYVEDTVLKLEHSLVSISKWEEEYHIPFLDKDHAKTRNETLFYIKCMTLNNDIPDYIYNALTNEDIARIEQYIVDNKTATWFNERDNTGGNKEIVTSELIYYWMIANRIPPECQWWHLSRLMTLIRICNIKNSPSEKMSEQETIERYRALNRARRKNGKG